MSEFNEDYVPNTISPFYNDRVFRTREEMMDWVQATTRNLGYVIVTQRTKKIVLGFVNKVYLMCDRGGEYKSSLHSTTHSGSKKCGCPFQLLAKYNHDLTRSDWKIQLYFFRFNENTSEQTYFTNTSSTMEYDFMGLSQHNVTYKKSLDYHKYIDQIPSVFRSYVKDIKNVLGDGNCGFRATASALGYNEGQWESIQRLLIDEMVQFETRYRNAFEEEYDGVFASLQWFGTTFAPPENWMIMPETGFLIVNKFNVIFHFISIEGNNSSTLFSLWRGPDRPVPR